MRQFNTEPWVDQLIIEYEQGKYALEKYRQAMDKEDADYEKENELVGSMISDMQFALEWMQRGRKPGNRRGIDRRSIYQRTIILDTELFPSLQIEPPPDELTIEEKRRVTDALLELSSRERQCFILHMAYGWSYQEIGDQVGVKRRTAQQYVDRAKEKVEKYKS